MAKKTETKKTAKKETLTFKGQKYTVLDRHEGKVKLTDGLIHFWVKEDVTA